MRVYKYSESPAFEILLFGYSVDGGPVQVVDLACGEQIPENILDALTDDTVLKWAFNANFERVCLSRYLRDMGWSLDPFHDNHPLSTEPARFLNSEGWRCSQAATMGLRPAWKGVGAVLNPLIRRWTRAALIRYFSVPCAPTKANGGRTWNLPSTILSNGRRSRSTTSATSRSKCPSSGSSELPGADSCGRVPSTRKSTTAASAST